MKALVEYVYTGNLLKLRVFEEDSDVFTWKIVRLSGASHCEENKKYLKDNLFAQQVVIAYEQDGTVQMLKIVDGSDEYEYVNAFLI